MTGRLPKDSDKIVSFEVIMHKHFGNTLLHITDEGLILASTQRGVIFDLAWAQLYTATPKGKKIMLTWHSTSDVRFTYGLKMKDIDLVMGELQRMNAKFAATQTFLESLHDTFKNEIIKNVNKIRTEFGNNKNKWHSTKIPENSTIIFDSSTLPVIASRHSDISSEIPNNDVWNDAWYDRSLKCFFTHNSLFKKISDFSKRAEQIKHKSNSSDGSISLEGLEIKFLFGYPATVLSWDGDGGAINSWTLLSTIRPEMLTVEMVLAKTNTDPTAHNLHYSTDSLEVYASKFHASVSVYETILYNADMRKYAIQTYPQLVARLNYLHENIPLDNNSFLDPDDDSHYDEENQAHNDPNFLKWMNAVSKHNT